MGEDKGRLIPELVGVQEVAGILNYDGRTVSALERRRAARAKATGQGTDFPEPIQRLAMGPVWVRADIEEYKARRSSKPARTSGIQTRRPRALRGISHKELERALRDPRAGLSIREKEVLDLRLGLVRDVGQDPGQDRRRPPTPQQKIAEELGVSLPTVKKAQQRAIQKLLGILSG